MKQNSVQQLPAQRIPVETGPARFGDDQAGVFIRADNALAFPVAIRSLLQEKKPEAACPVFWKAQMENLLYLLESSPKEDRAERDQTSQACPRAEENGSS